MKLIHFCTYQPFNLLLEDHHHWHKFLRVQWGGGGGGVSDEGYQKMTHFGLKFIGSGFGELSQSDPH